MSFADLAITKKTLGIPASATKDDDDIQCAVDAANAEVLEYLCLEDCPIQQYTVFADIECDEWATAVDILPRPISSIIEVKNLGNVLDPSTYRLQGGVLKLCDKREFCPGCRAVEITLEAGFAMVPSHLAYGVAQLAGSLYRIDTPGLQSEGIGRYRYRRFDPSVLPGPPGWPLQLWRAMAPFGASFRIAGYVPIASVDI